MREPNIFFCLPCCNRCDSQNGPEVHYSIFGMKSPQFAKHKHLTPNPLSYLIIYLFIFIWNFENIQISNVKIWKRKRNICLQNTDIYERKRVRSGPQISRESSHIWLITCYIPFPLSLSFRLFSPVSVCVSVLNTTFIWYKAGNLQVWNI